MRIQDIKSNVKVESYKINWTWNKNTERWVRHMLKGKSVLNIPCGQSKIGTVRADIDPKMKPDVICDVHNLPFKENSFDAVLCDPPFSFYSHWKWVNRLSSIAKQHMLLSVPSSVPWIKGFKKELFATIQRGNFFVRYWVYYTKKNRRLDSFV